MAKITIDPPRNVRAGTPFQVSGSLSGYNSPPVLQLANNPPAPAKCPVSVKSGSKSLTVSWPAPSNPVSYHPLPSPASVSKVAFYFRHGPMQAGQHTIAVTDGKTGAIVGFAVQQHHHYWQNTNP
jgi:hypothetical protein